MSNWEESELILGYNWETEKYSNDEKEGKKQIFVELDLHVNTVVRS